MLLLHASHRTPPSATTVPGVQGLQRTAPDVLETVPMGHGRQAVASVSASRNVPRKQGVHSAAPASDHAPRGQGRQASASSLFR